MQQMHEPPEDAGAIRSRRRPPRRRASVTLPDTWTPEDLEAILASHQDAVAAQIEQGVRALHHTAGRLMNHIARNAARVSPEDTSRGLLTHVDERYQALNLRMERLEGALRKVVQTFKGSIQGSDGRAVAALARRIDGLAEAFKEVASRTGQGLARVAQRQEALLEERLDGMRQSIDALTRAMEAPPPLPGPPEIDEGPGPEHAVSVFVERLRAAEDRLERASGDLAGWDPFDRSSQAEAST
jgi:uncharacterized protein YukE